MFLANRAQEVYEALGIARTRSRRASPGKTSRRHLQHPAQDGGLALREGRELARAGGRARPVRGGLQRASPLGPPAARRQAALARRRSWASHPACATTPKTSGAPSFERAHDRVLDALGYARLMHWRIYRRRGARGRRDVALWLSGDALSVEHEWGDPIPLRGRVRAGPGA